MSGLFLSLEGGDGSGKTTQLELLGRRISAMGRRVVKTREPGGTQLGSRIRESLVQRTEDPPTPRAELFLYAADRSHHLEIVVRPGLSAGHVVLTDRYADATEAYQGWGRGLDLELVRSVNRMATGGLNPHRTVLLDLPPRLGIERALSRRPDFGAPLEERFESEVLAFHERVRVGYLEIAKASPDRFRVVDADRAIETVAAAVWAAVADLF